MKTQSGWKRILAVGCSHGIHADPIALTAVLKFRNDFKPDICIHLGDAVDATALRSGAKGTNDESAKIEPDVDSGMQFLEQLQPNIYLWGNHEDRISRLREHHNAIWAFAAKKIHDGIYEICKKQNTKIHKYRGVYQKVVFGGVRYMHGVFFNEMCCRDHAESFGNVVFAHAHRAGVATGRRCDKPKGYCVGTLTRFENMDYAKARRSTLGWSQALVWGYFKNDQSQLWLHEHHGGKQWLLP